MVTVMPDGSLKSRVHDVRQLSCLMSVTVISVNLLCCATGYHLCGVRISTDAARQPIKVVCLLLF